MGTDFGLLGVGFGRLGASGFGSRGPRIVLTGASIAENSVQGSAVGVLSVVRGTGTYTFSLTNNDGLRFQVSGVNGENLQAGATLINREIDGSSRLVRVQATNGVDPAILRDIVVSVVDVNEFAPVITSDGGGPTAAINFAENGTGPVTTVVATDADATAVITYSISGGADASKFAIGSSTGVLTFIAPPDFENPTDVGLNNTYEVIVQASDGTNVDTQTITVTVTNVVEGVGPPSLDLVATSDTGSPTDNITSDNTPDIDLLTSVPVLEGDILRILDGVTTILTHVVTASEVASSTIALGLPSLIDGEHSLTATHEQLGVESGASAPLVVTIDTGAPVFTSSNTISVAENATLSHALTVSDLTAVTFAIRTTAQDATSLDAARFDLSGTTLRWFANGTKNFEAPDDSNVDNAYVVVVRATDAAGNFVDQTVTASVSNVNEAPTIANPIPDQIASAGVGFNFQFAANAFADPDAGDVLTYSATKSDNTALPAWLAFTASTRTFSGTPAAGDAGIVDIKVTATDTGSLAVSDIFRITVSAGVVSSVQRGSITIAGTNVTATAIISAINTSRSIVLYNGATAKTTSPSLFTLGNSTVAITNSTTITATRGTVPGTPSDMTVYFTVIEFASGVNSIQHGEVSVGNAPSNTATISAVGANAFVVWRGAKSGPSGAGEYPQDQASIELTNATTVTARTEAHASVTRTVAFTVCDFDSTIVQSVQQRSLVSPTNASQDDTIASIDTTRTMVFYNGVSDYGVQNMTRAAQAVLLTNATTVNATRFLGGATGTVKFTVVQFATGVFGQAVQRGTITIPSTASSATATITSVNSAKTIVGWGAFWAFNAAPNVTYTALELTNATTVTGKIDSAVTNAVNVRYEIAEFT